MARWDGARCVDIRESQRNGLKTQRKYVNGYDYEIQTNR